MRNFVVLSSFLFLLIKHLTIYVQCAIIDGILYWLDERQQMCVAEVQKDYNILVYHIIHSHTEFGELLSMLYVSRHREEWEEDREFLKQGYPIAYVKNLSIPEFSEFGSIGIQPCIGGVKRIA